MKNFIYQMMKLINPFLSNSLYTNLLFLFNCIRLRQPFYWQDIHQPKTLNEKINYIKYKDRNPLAPLVADKLAVREYIKEKIGEEYLVPLLAVLDSPEQIDFSVLPDQFVMKLNNGSGYNLICTDKSALDERAVIRNFQEAFQKDIYVASREWHYRLIPPKIIVEQLLAYNLMDYKFFCSKKSGPFAVQVDEGRFTNHKRDLYDPNWQKLPYRIRYKNTDNLIQKPGNLKQMLSIASKLSEDFVFCRVDLYEHEGRVYFGEITLHPGGGVEPLDSYRSDLSMGEFILV